MCVYMQIYLYITKYKFSEIINNALQDKEKKE